MHYCAVLREKEQAKEQEVKLTGITWSIAPSGMLLLIGSSMSSVSVTSTPQAGRRVRVKVLRNQIIVLVTVTGTVKCCYCSKNEMYCTSSANLTEDINKQIMEGMEG